MPYDVDHEVKLVQFYIAKIGEQQADGTFICTFGQLFNDEEAEQVFESLVGSLKAAKRRKIIDFKGQMLLMPMHKDVPLHLLEPLPAGTVVEPPKPVDDHAK
mmetsp:Transcript_44115/g.111190  ORF Transcript_44115/g.111190 Transcript_44115/m.111190 type:complete len:102 (+) Transcript_44115:87-392(+)|eukprot:CAMPEP_0177659060 /NCGR_PEP_ID=MMETSP0447-20121125/17223_1 /TAXON_ID=0 /ORGANISM="Stygamoeba regulata, Strain BSH-02190019" /LENGTH=101 /DNA_ID=CAMNT_0019163869 /DNA_START=74 /DNA_END=379 /DNA_ORIENTATION=-